MKAVRLAHRGLIVFCLVMLGSYSSPPPMVSSSADLSKLLEQLPSADDLYLTLNPARPDRPIINPFGPDPTPRSSRNWIWLCHAGPQGRTQTAWEAHLTYLREAKRWPLSRLLEEYSSARFLGLSTDEYMDSVFRPGCSHLYDFASAQEIPEAHCVFKPDCEDLHAVAMEATPTFRCAVAPSDLGGPRPAQAPLDLSEGACPSISYAHEVPLNRWKMETKGLSAILPGAPTSDELATTAARIRASPLYHDVEQMDLASAIEHVERQRAQSIEKWALANKSAFSIPVPSRALLSVLLSGLLIYVSVFVWSAIRLVGARSLVSRHCARYPWIGTTGRGGAAILTAVLTATLPYLTVSAAIRHEMTATQLMGKQYELSRFGNSSWLLDSLEALSSGASTLLVCGLGLLAALLIVGLKGSLEARLD